jgi:hypothetical protein
MVEVLEHFTHFSNVPFSPLKEAFSCPDEQTRTDLNQIDSSLLIFSVYLIYFGLLNNFFDAKSYQ